MVVVAGNGSHQNSPPPTSKSPFKRLLLPCDRTPTATRVGIGFSATRSSLSSDHRPQQPEDEPASATSACSEIRSVLLGRNHSPVLVFCSSVY
ncbi:hypothetical protein LXL04_017969 [Taraxacum kok-saghyz]